jgi:GntR family transcriptional regulator
MVDHGAARPAYQQLAGILRDKIASGEYAPGQRLPSADRLAQEYDVAPNTARKSLRVLRDEGLAVMVPSLGTFVVSPR